MGSKYTKNAFVVQGRFYPLFIKNVGALHLEKTGDLFLVITVCRLSGVSFPEKLTTLFLLITLVVHSEVAHISVFRACKKVATSFVGPFFVGPRPVRPNMLNMPKSAAVAVALCRDSAPIFSLELLSIPLRFALRKGVEKGKEKGGESKRRKE